MVGGRGYTGRSQLSCPALLPRYHPNVKKIVYLSLGSNLGDRQANLRNATGRLLDLGYVQEVSSLYETEPVEFTDQPWFLNCAVAMRTELIPREFLAGILEIERSMGRQRTQPKGPRIIDIDILLFGAATINTPQLTVPHPAMAERRFVLEPLAEIAPDVKHPVAEEDACANCWTLFPRAARRSRKYLAPKAA